MDKKRSDDWDNPWLQIGLGILGNNYGHHGAFAPAVGGGMQQGMQNLARMRALAEQTRRREHENAILKAQQDAIEALPDEYKSWAKAGVSLDTIYKEMQGKGAGADIYGTPIYGQGADGSLGLYTIPKAGNQVVSMQFPEGVTPIQPLQFMNLQDRYAGVNRYTGQPVSNYAVGLGPGDQPSTKAAQTAATTEARMLTENAVQAQIDLPKAERAANVLLQKIRETKNDPALGRVTGVLGAFPNAPGSAANRAQSRISQLQGEVFLQAYEDLKGGGQITEVEGRKAEQAKARMDQAMGTADFTDALTEFENEVIDLLNLARSKAGKGRGEAPATAPLDPSKMTPEERRKALEAAKAKY